MIHTQSFTGEFPRILPHALPENAAQFSVDCDFMTGALTGINDRAAAAGIPATNIKSLYVHDGLTSSWYGWTYDVDAVRGPIANDAYHRFYWTDGDRVYVSRADIGSGGTPQSNNRYWVGVPVPTSAPTVNVAQTFEIDGVSSMTTELICESADGTVSSSLVKVPVVTSNSMSGKTLEIESYGFTCVTSVAQTDIKVIGTFTASYLDPFSANTNFTGLPMYGTGTAGITPYYVYNAGLQYPQITGYADNVPLPLTFYRIGTAGWFCTDPSATVPTFLPDTVAGANAAVTAATTSMAVRLTLNKTDGSKSIGIIRPLAAKSTLPPEMSHISASFTVVGTKVTVSLVRNAEAIEARAYVYTWVNNYGEESAPSPALEMDAVNGQKVSLLLARNAPAGYCPIKLIRLYRSAASTGQYLFVGEVTYNSAPVTEDTVPSDQLGEPLATLGWQPPESGLKGIVALPNGILAAFKENEIHFSEPYLPSVWKTSNIMTTASSVVSICPAEGGLFVTTTAHPYFINGMTPDSMTQTKIMAIQAGVSKGSICNIGSSVVYASNDGLVMARGLDVSLDFSFKFFTRNEWRSRFANKLHLMRLNAHDGHLLAWFEDGTPGFLMRVDEVEGSFTRMTDPISAAFVHPLSDSLYLAYGGSLTSFKSALARKAFSWKSKDYVQPRPVTFSALQVFGTGTVRLTLYADGAAKWTGYVTLDEVYGVNQRLPSGFLARTWSLLIEGSANAKVTAWTLANSFEEMKRV